MNNDNQKPKANWYYNKKKNMLSKNDLPAICNENEICFDRESSTSSNKSYSS